MAYGFINFLFLFLSHISFIFSFSYLVYTASISTLPYSFFFPLPFCSILFPFMNMSHHRFPLYHHWSPSLDFFSPFCLLSPFCSISELPIGVGLVMGLWFSIVIGVGIGLWVMGLWLRIVIGVGLWVVCLGCGSLFYLESPIRYSLFSESLIRCSIVSLCLIVEKVKYFSRVFQGFLFFFFKWFQPFDVCFFVRNKNELWVFLILRNCLLGQCLLKVRVRRSFWIYFFCLIAVLGSIAWFLVY